MQYTLKINVIRSFVPRYRNAGSKLYMLAFPSLQTSSNSSYTEEKADRVKGKIWTNCRKFS